MTFPLSDPPLVPPGLMEKGENPLQMERHLHVTVMMMVASPSTNRLLVVRKQESFFFLPFILFQI